MGEHDFRALRLGLSEKKAMLTIREGSMILRGLTELCSIDKRCQVGCNRCSVASLVQRRFSNVYHVILDPRLPSFLSRVLKNIGEPGDEATKVQLNGTYQQAKSRFLHVTTSETQESQPNIKMHNFRTVSSLDPRQKFILLHNLAYK